MENINKQKTGRVHRIGSVTLGVVLIVFGILFLIHMFMPTVSYLFIFKLWPCIFILLGIEILLGNYKRSDSFVYDKTAVFLLIVLTFFAMTFAFLDYGITNNFLHAGDGYLYVP